MPTTKPFSAGFLLYTFFKSFMRFDFLSPMNTFHRHSTVAITSDRSRWR